MAWAWCAIMWVMKRASAAVEASRPLSARALAMAVSSAAFGGGFGVGAAEASWRDEPQARVAARRLIQSARAVEVEPTGQGRKLGIDREKYHARRGGGAA